VRARCAGALWCWNLSWFSTFDFVKNVKYVFGKKFIEVYVHQKISYSLDWQSYCKNKTVQFFSDSHRITKHEEPSLARRPLGQSSNQFANIKVYTINPDINIIVTPKIHEINKNTISWRASKFQVLTTQCMATACRNNTRHYSSTALSSFLQELTEY